MVVSAGAAGSFLSSVEPMREDLQVLAEAALAPSGPPRPAEAAASEPAPARPLDRLLEKYPDLARIPERERPEVFYQKLRADLLGGAPIGIWLVVLMMLPYALIIFATQVMIAGPLLRRLGTRPAVLMPYLERAIPTTILAFLTPAIAVGATVLRRHVESLVHFDMFAVLISFLPMFGLLVLALTASLRVWPWPLRLALHAGWMLSAGLAAAYWTP